LRLFRIWILGFRISGSQPPYPSIPSCLRVFVANVRALHLSSALYKSPLFMQNKPNLQKPKITPTCYRPCHSDRSPLGAKRRNLLQYSRRLSNRLFGPVYQRITTCIMQNKPNFLKPKTNASLFTAKNYEEKSPLPIRKKQTQTNPIPSRPTSIQHRVSSIHHRVSRIQHRVSSIQHRVSSIQNPASLRKTKPMVK